MKRPIAARNACPIGVPTKIAPDKAANANRRAPKANWRADKTAASSAPIANETKQNVGMRNLNGHTAT
jgi:hypothetical protein